MVQGGKKENILGGEKLVEGSGVRSRSEQKGVPAREKLIDLYGGGRKRRKNDRPPNPKKSGEGTEEPARPQKKS